MKSEIRVRILRKKFKNLEFKVRIMREGAQFRGENCQDSEINQKSEMKGKILRKNSQNSEGKSLKF